MKTCLISVGNNDYELAAHVTTHVTKIHGDMVDSQPPEPVLVYVNQQGNSSIGCYVYTIGKGTQTYTSVLQRGENAGLQDLATNLGRVISRKLQCPSYVCLSGHFELSDYGELSREVLSRLSE